MKNKQILKIVLIGMFAVIMPDLIAQCPMCKMAASSNLSNGGTAGAGLNFGILYILALPYLLVSVIGYIWWRNRKTNLDDNEVAPPEDMTFSEN
jgi:hypothetical protein